MMKTLSEYIEDMLLFKESIGYSRQSYEYDLARFCRFMESKQLNVSELKEDVVLNWCSRWESESPTGARRRIQSVRELLKYLSAIGIDCYGVDNKHYCGLAPIIRIADARIWSDVQGRAIFSYRRM